MLPPLRAIARTHAFDSLIYVLQNSLPLCVLEIDAQLLCQYVDTYLQNLDEVEYARVVALECETSSGIPNVLSTQRERVGYLITKSLSCSK